MGQEAIKRISCSLAILFNFRWLTRFFRTAWPLFVLVVVLLLLLPFRFPLTDVDRDMTVVAAAGCCW